MGPGDEEFVNSDTDECMDKGGRFLLDKDGVMELVIACWTG